MATACGGFFCLNGRGVRKDLDSIEIELLLMYSNSIINILI